MTSRGIMAGMGIGLGAIVVAAAYAARQVIGEPSAPVDVTLLAIAGGLVIAWLVQPLLGLGRSAPLPRPSQAPAPDQPAKPVPYAARAFRVNGHLWWPAAIGWSADAIFIRNSEGHFRYALDACRAWKEDDALILLHTADNRYWCLPKQALADAGRLDSFAQLLQQRVAQISPYRVLYR